MTDEQVLAHPSLPRPKKDLGGSVKTVDGTVCRWKMTVEPELTIQRSDNPHEAPTDSQVAEVLRALPKYVLDLHDRYWHGVASLFETNSATCR